MLVLVESSYIRRMCVLIHARKMIMKLKMIIRKKNKKKKKRKTNKKKKKRKKKK